MSQLSAQNPPESYDKGQQTALETLKAELTTKGIYNPETQSDYQLYRFLRARKYNINKTLEMISAYCEWRGTEKVEDIVQNFSFEEYNKVFEIYPQFYHKTDKIGRPLYIEQFINFDINKVFAVTSQERFVFRHIREYEKFTRYRTVACSIKFGRNIENSFTILDMKGAPLSQFNQVRKFLSRLSAIASDYYPEALGKMFIINAPVLFSAVWTVIKTMIDEHTASKINIIGSGYKKELLKYIDPENLPSFLGGTCDCPGGCNRSDLGPWNDGTTPGYPIAFWEDMKIRDRK